MISVRRADPADPGPRALLEASHALMQSLFAPEENHFLSIEALQGPDIRFFAASDDGEVLGTGALAIKDGYGEIKSMFTAEKARGRGIGAMILIRLEEEAPRARPADSTAGNRQHTGSRAPPLRPRRVQVAPGFRRLRTDAHQPLL